MAEVVFRDRAESAGLDVVVDSAGTSSWHVGDDADRRARATLQAHGYPVSHRARGFDRRWLDERDLILAMDRSHLEDLRGLARTPEQAAKIRLFRSFDPALAHLDEMDSRLDVPDPYYGPADGFENVLAMVEAASDGLVAYLAAAR